MATTTRNTALSQSQQALMGKRVRLGTVGRWAVLLVLIFITLFPLWWMIRTALTYPDLVYKNTDSLLPVDATTLNFRRVTGAISEQELQALIEQSPNISAGSLHFIRYLENSLIVSGLVTLGQILFSSMAAYAFARMRFPFRDQIFFLYLTGLMVPGIILFIPNFVLMRQLHWIGTYQGMIAPAFLMTPFAVFFMRQFFLGLNRDLEEAAKLDGASPFGVFWRVSLPLSQGPLLTLGILTFIASWNDYLWPLLVGRDEKVRVLTVALGIFRSQTPQGAPDWSGLMASTVVAVIPMMLLFIFLGRKVIDSIQFSGFK